MKKILILVLIFCIAVNVVITAFASDMSDAQIETPEFEAVNLDSDSIDAVSAVLIEANTGMLLFEKNPIEALPPASVTKIMTLLLVCEAIDRGAFKLDDKVKISANAAGMGGSQVFLEEGEEFTVEELLKCTVIASANDAAVALAELTAGSEAAFVARMNERASELGLKSTHFENTTGLDDDVTGHLMSAFDIALISKELIKHEIVLKYSCRWQDSIRDGEFILTNTNRLVRYYEGCTGLKTGYTDKAGYCITATAERDGMKLIAVIMGAKSRDDRNNAVRTLFDWGFANYSLFSDDEEYLEDIPVLRSKTQKAKIYMKGFNYLADKGSSSKIEKVFEIPDDISAPIRSGDVIGSVKYYIEGKEIGVSDIYVKEEVKSITRLELFLEIFLKPFKRNR